MTRASNTRSELGISAVGTTWREARQNEMRALDALPIEVQRTIRENNTNLGVTSVAAYFSSILRQVGNPARAIAITVDKLRSLEAGDVDVFAGKFKGAYRTEYPHKAAGATILRYGALGPAPRRRGAHPRIRGFGLPREIQEVAE